MSVNNCDQRDGIPSTKIPKNHSKRSKSNITLSVRRHIKQILCKEGPPYDKFESYYPLCEIIDLYNDIWFQEDTTESEEYYCEECSCCYGFDCTSHDFSNQLFSCFKNKS